METPAFQCLCHLPYRWRNSLLWICGGNRFEQMGVHWCDANRAMIQLFWRSPLDRIILPHVPQEASRASYFLDKVMSETYRDSIFRWVAGWTATRTPGGGV